MKIKNSEWMLKNYNKLLTYAYNIVGSYEDLIKEETATYTILVLLEYLNPKERAAELLEISTENSRQLLSRANKRLKDCKYKKYTPHSGQSFETLGKYQKALVQADMIELQNLLVNDIKLSADGGAKVRHQPAICFWENESSITVISSN